MHIDFVMCKKRSKPPWYDNDLKKKSNSKTKEALLSIHSFSYERQFFKIQSSRKHVKALLKLKKVKRIISNYSKTLEDEHSFFRKLNNLYERKIDQ